MRLPNPCLAAFAALVATLNPAASASQDAAPPAAVAQGVPGLVAPDAKVEVLVEGLKFAEGPAADARGAITFCDLATSEVFRLERGPGAWTRSKVAGGTKGLSGLAWSADGALVGCQMRAGSVVTLVPGEGGQVTLSPRALSGDAARAGLNDLAFDRDGRLWVTNMGDRRHPEWAGVWCIPATGEPVHSKVGATRPNGIRWSNQGGGSGTLWVADYARPRAFRVPAVPGKLGLGGETSLDFAAAPNGSGGADGLAIDAQGNAWIALPGHDRIAVVAADGTPRGFLDVPDGPSNCAFGGADGKTLFITTRSTVRSVPTLVEGAWVARAFAKAAPAPSAPAAADAPARPAP
jgi:gluconolactonase